MTEKHSDRENRTARQTDSGSAGQAGDVNGAGDSGNAGQAGDVNGAGNSCSTEYAGSTGDSGSAGLAGAAGAPGGVATQDELLVQKAARARSRIRFRLFMGGAGTLLILLALTCVCVGEYPMQPGTALHILAGKLSGAVPDWLPMQENVLFGLRLPRVAASMLVGCALAVSGAAFQGVFKNPLVSPDFLGVSSGATVGAASAILLSLGSALMQGFAFLGGLAAVLLTMSIPRLLRASSNIMLVLSGIIVGGLMSSVLGLLKYLADPDTQLADIVYWQMGSFSYVELRPLLAILPVVVLPAIVLLGLSWRINVLSLGEREARTLGVRVERTRGIILLCATLMTSGAVCMAGTIGWVGLVCPHFARLLVGQDNARVLPASMVIGALFMLLVDTAARTVGPLEMPISILTGIIGAPFYAWLLFRQRRDIR